MAPALPQSLARGWETQGPALFVMPGDMGRSAPCTTAVLQFTAGHLIYKLFLLLLSNSHKPKK